jgi:exonuclease SbcD
MACIWDQKSDKDRLPGSRMKFVHAADIHLDSPLQALALGDAVQVERMRRATRDAFARLIDVSIGQGVAFVVLAGDLYDHDRPNMQIAVFLRNQLARLKEKGIRVVMIKGNHDADNRMTSALMLPDNTQMLSDCKPETVRFDDLAVRVAIHGQSFKSGPVTENLAASYPVAHRGYFNIGVLHTSLAGNDDHDTYAPCSLEELATRGYGYWALGHIHKGAVLRQDPWIVYSGNAQGRHVKETGPKGCYLVEVDEDHRVSTEFIALDVVRWLQVEVDLKGLWREAELTDRIRAGLARAYRDGDGRPCAVRLNLSGPTVLHETIERRPSRLRQTVLELAGEIAGDDIWIEKIRNLTMAPVTRVDVGPNETSNELIRIIREVANDRMRVKELLEKELEPLRTKLPDEMKELPALALLKDPGLARDALARLEPQLAARLAGEEDA